jgi:Mn2+/Fe2+ NRAMP family transporter
MLVAVIAALIAVLPLWGYSANRAHPAEQRAAYRSLLARKVWGLRVAGIAFGLGLLAFAWLISSALWCR